MGEEMRCDPTCHAIMKFSGVFPRGLNRLHDAIEELNSSELFAGKDKKNQIVLLRSDFKEESGSTWGYVVEIRIPFITQGQNEHQARPVPLTVVQALMQTLGVFG